MCGPIWMEQISIYTILYPKQSFLGTNLIKWSTVHFRFCVSFRKITMIQISLYSYFWFIWWYHPMQNWIWNNYTRNDDDAEETMDFTIVQNNFHYYWLMVWFDYLKSHDCIGFRQYLHFAFALTWNASLKHDIIIFSFSIRKNTIYKILCNAIWAVLCWCDETFSLIKLYSK